VPPSLPPAADPVPADYRMLVTVSGAVQPRHGGGRAEL